MDESDPNFESMESKVIFHGDAGLAAEGSQHNSTPSLSNSLQAEFLHHIEEWFSFVRSGNLTGIQSVLLSSQVNSGTYSALVQSADDTGMTALHWAAREGQFSVARYLVQDAAANVFAEDFEGMRASDHAREMYYMDLARYLEGHEMSIQHGVVCMQVMSGSYDHRKYLQLCIIISTCFPIKRVHYIPLFTQPPREPQWSPT